MSSVLPPLVVELRARAGEFNTEMAKARKEVNKLEKDAAKSGETFNRSGHMMQAAGKAVAFGIAGAAVAVGGFAVEATIAAQKADANLNVALKNAGASAEAFDPKIKAADSSLRKLGFTNAQTNQALAQMTVALGSPQKALDTMGVAADIARMKNIDLGTASMLVAKAMEGQTRPLRQLGIDLPINTKNAQSMVRAQEQLKTQTAAYTAMLDTYNAKSKHTAADTARLAAAHQKLLFAQQQVAQAQQAGGLILDALRKRVGGAAAAYGDTFPGKIAAARAQMDAMGESIGGVLIPVITKVISVGAKWTSWLVQHKAVLDTVLVVVGGLAALLVGAYVAGLVSTAAATALSIARALGLVTATEAQTAATGEAAVAQDGLNVALAANPIGLVVIAIAALAAGIVYAYHHFKTFRDVVQDVWHVVDMAFHAIADVVGAAFTWIKHHIDLVIVGALGPLGVAIVLLKDHWNAVWNGIKTVVSDVWNFLKPIFDAITKGVEAIIGGIGKVAGLVGKIGGGALKGLGDLIPHFAAGGISRGGLAMVGENGPELVALPGGAQVYSASDTARMGHVPGAVSPGAGGGITLPISLTLDGQVIYRNTIQNAQRYKLRNGATALT